MSLGYQLKAWGRFRLPDGIMVAGRRYDFVRVFKHDFFAATLLFQAVASDNAAAAGRKGTLSAGGDGGGDTGPVERVVLKLGRRGDFLGIPLGWLGRMLIRHEMRILGRLRDLEGVPRILAGWGEWGMVYGYLPGCSLDEKPQLPDDFFDRLDRLIRRIHDRRIAYVDMNKRGNILLGPDRLPGIIDFQIACHIPRRLVGSQRLADGLLSVLQAEDRYHLLKHKRRFRGDLLSEREREHTRRISGWIALHRALTRPLRDLRRRILAGLFRRGRLVIDQTMPLNPETDPGRWSRKSPPSG